MRGCALPLGGGSHSTVTLLARFLGLSMSQPSPRGRPRGGPEINLLGRSESALRKSPLTLRFYAPPGAAMRGCALPLGGGGHSTVTLLARFLGLSMSQPRMRAT